jgi:predicted ATPase
VIESVQLQNFKSLRDVELAGLQRLTVIVGPNGVGKSSVLQGLHLLRRLETSQTLGRLLNDGWGQIRLITRGAERLRIHCSGDDAWLSLAADVNGRYVIELSHEGQQHAYGSHTDSGLEAPSEIHRKPGVFDHPFFKHTSKPVFLELSPKQLGNPSAASPKPRIASDGTGLATLLAYFAGAERDTLESIETELREILGITGRIRTFPDEIEVEERENIRIDDQLVPRITRRRQAAVRFELEIDDLGSIPGDLLSEGTLITLGLLALLYQASCPSLILIDDIDQGLHPDAQAKLIAALRKLLAQRPELQILCTSHSPYLLDLFEPQEIQVMSLHDGQVAAARLDRHDEWPKWKGKLQSGEFWQSVGEAWVTPAPHDNDAGEAHVDAE